MLNVPLIWVPSTSTIKILSASVAPPRLGLILRVEREVRLARDNCRSE